MEAKNPIKVHHVRHASCHRFSFATASMTCLPLRSQTPARLGRIHRNQSHRETRCKGHGWFHPSQSGEVKQKCVQHSCVLQEWFFQRKSWDSCVEASEFTSNNQRIEEVAVHVCLCACTHLCAGLLGLCAHRKVQCSSIVLPAAKKWESRLHAHRPRKLFVFFLRSLHFINRIAAIWRTFTASNH